MVEKPVKILILRFSSIGDIVLTTPVIRNLKQQLPNSEIHFFTKKSFETILINNPYADKLHLLDNNLKVLIKDLKKVKFDYIIDLHNNIRTSIIKKQLGVKSYSFNKLNWRKWLYVNLKINRMPDLHIVDRYMQTAAKLGVVNDNVGLDYYIPSKDDIAVETLPEAFQKSYVAVAIGANHNTKKLPLNKLIELCKTINRPIVLLGGKEDFNVGELVSSHFSNLNAQLTNVQVYNACGKLNLNQSSSLLKQADEVFSHDTGLMHIASAFKKRITVIWGNTTPQLGMYPYQTSHQNYEVKDLSCRPCSKIGYKECPLIHFKCMQDQVFTTEWNNPA